MLNDLSEVLDRIGYCRRKTLALASGIDAFIRSGAYRISHEVDPATGDGTFYIHVEKEVPTEFPIEAGLIIHELRASLDSLACILAARNGKGTKDVYFPISRSQAIFETDGLKRKLRNLSQADRDMIAGLRPYAGGNDMLFALHEADLTRKHTRLIFTASRLGALGIKGGQIKSIELLDADAPITSEKMAFAILSAATKIDADVGVDIDFQEPRAIRGRPVITTLHEFTNLVESIVQLFR